MNAEGKEKEKNTDSVGNLKSYVQNYSWDKNDRRATPRPLGSGVPPVALGDWDGASARESDGKPKNRT